MDDVHGAAPSTPAGPIGGSARPPAIGTALATLDQVVTPPPRGTASFRFEVGLEGEIKAVTASVRGLLGREPADLLGTSMSPLIHPDDLDRARVAWRDVLARPEQSQTVRVRLRPADGSWRWFSSTAWNALDDPNRRAVLLELHDIEELVAAEHALQASEEGFRTLAESLPVGVGVLDQHGTPRFANRRLEAILRETGLLVPGQAFDRPWFEQVAPALAAEVRSLLAPGEPGGAPITGQVDVVAPDGTGVHLLATAVTTSHRDDLRVIVSVQNITDQVRTGQAHAHLVQVVDEVRDVVIVSQVDGPITYLNQSARRFFGDVVGRELREFMDPAVQAVTDTVVAESIVRLEAWTGDFELTDLDGVVHTMATTVSPVLDPTGTELHVGITMRDATARRAHERELARLARHDPLTGLPNRLAIVERIEAARDGGAPDDAVTICFIDLDNLKVVNDGLGHSAGDRLLQAVARELEAEAPPDSVGRFGGDEFVVVLDRVGDDDALDRAEGFLEAIGRAAVFGVANHVTASIGVATCRRAEIDAEGLIRDADAAMYAAKRQGRSRCARFDDALRERVTRRFLVESSLRAAIANDDLAVHLQPLVSLDGSDRIVGFEALCRWEQVSPAEFIPVAEDSGLVVPLGSQVLAQTLAAWSRLASARADLARVHVGVNVSARELHDPGFAARTLEALEASEVPPELVVLELTESVLIDPTEEVDRTLAQLRAAGIALALDDFGSGYSSLTYLRRYPIDILKLDITYTQGMVTDPGSRVIVEALVTMAQRLGLWVVAEGIETTEHLAAARGLGIEIGQGYLLGRPAPLEDHLTPPG
jgi:diguanylate cyclase (GGDEF)-like protein/PAS domain S-box-containing protein